MRVLWVFLTVVPTALGWLCPAYVCDPPDMEWADWICGMSKPYNASEYALKTDACAEGETCQEVEIMFSGHSICVGEQPQVTSQPGEPCDDLHLCSSSECVDGTCTALMPGAACKNVGDCTPGYVCRHAKCKPLLKLGEWCFEDAECPMKAGCSPGRHWWSPGTCVEYLSIPPQQKVLSCEDGVGMLALNPFCASTLCYTLNGENYCADFVKSNGPLPIIPEWGYANCTSTPDSVSGFTAQAEFDCGATGFEYCALFPGDQIMQAYLNDVHQYLNSSAIAQCNSSSRGWLPTYLGWWWCAEVTFAPSRQMIIDYYLANFFVEVVNADMCALKMTMPQYYNALVSSTN